jgi:hypothetical protein
MLSTPFPHTPGFAAKLKRTTAEGAASTNRAKSWAMASLVLVTNARPMPASRRVISGLIDDVLNRLDGAGIVGLSKPE